MLCRCIVDYIVLAPRCQALILCSLGIPAQTKKEPYCSFCRALCKSQHILRCIIRIRVSRLLEVRNLVWEGTNPVREFPKIRGTLFGVLIIKDPTISGTILGSRTFGNSYTALPSTLLCRHQPATPAAVQAYELDIRGLDTGLRIYEIPRHVLGIPKRIVLPTPKSSILILGIQLH